MRTFAQWLISKWSDEADEEQKLLDSYRALAGGPQFQRVLKSLLDRIYCTVYEGNDPLLLAFHNGRRSVVQEILENLDRATNPNKYLIKLETEEKTDGLAG